MVVEKESEQTADAVDAHQPAQEENADARNPSRNTEDHSRYVEGLLE